jgi:hypothetical protein
VDIGFPGHPKRFITGRKVGKPGTLKKSAATNAKMAEAQQARWAKVKAGK